MRRNPISNPKPIRPTGDIRAVEQPDGTYTYKVMDEYAEIIPAGVPWGRVLLSLAMGALVVLLVLGAVSAWSYLTGGGVTAQLTTCPVHLAHQPLPTALPSVPVH